MTNDIPGQRLQRALTPDELQVTVDRIIAATNSRDVVLAAANGARAPWLEDESLPIAEDDPQSRSAPGEFSIPRSQWQFIVDVAHQRMTEWGNSIHTSLVLIAALPSSHVDPQVVAPGRPEHDFRPPLHEMHVTRGACDVIAACSNHLQALAVAYGFGDSVHVKAAVSWNVLLCRLFSMILGSDTQIDADGDLSLVVTTGGGTVYRLHFVPMPRSCTWPGCGARIGEDGTVHPAAEARPVLVHEHTPDYPLDAPQPGIWQFTT